MTKHTADGKKGSENGVLQKRGCSSEGVKTQNGKTHNVRKKKDTMILIFSKNVAQFRRD